MGILLQEVRVPWFQAVEVRILPWSLLAEKRERYLYGELAHYHLSVLHTLQRAPMILIVAPHLARGRERRRCRRQVSRSRQIYHAVSTVPFEENRQHRIASGPSASSQKRRAQVLY